MMSLLVETSTNHCKKVVGKFSEKCSVKTSNGTSKDHRDKIKVPDCSGGRLSSELEMS